MRKSKSGECCIEYLLGTYKRFEVRLAIGNSVCDDGIYISLAIVNNEGDYISYKEYDDEILNIIIPLGFNESGDIIKYKYSK